MQRRGVHPRVRGAVRPHANEPCIMPGPSPRARGSLDEPASSVADLGSIPACAGQSGSKSRKSSACWVHPRVRGAVPLPNAPEGSVLGPSPRARGSPRQRSVGFTHYGSIPACAGQSTMQTDPAPCVRVHPRVRGAVLPRSHRRPHRSGPSPRARGSHDEPIVLVGGPGSIPACAGQSCWRNLTTLS